MCYNIYHLLVAFTQILLLAGFLQKWRLSRCSSFSLVKICDFSLSFVMVNEISLVLGLLLEQSWQIEDVALSFRKIVKNIFYFIIAALMSGLHVLPWGLPLQYNSETDLSTGLFHYKSSCLCGSCNNIFRVKNFKVASDKCPSIHSFIFFLIDRIP